MIECEPHTNSLGVITYVTGVNPLITCFDGNHWIHFAFLPPGYTEYGDYPSLILLQRWLAIVQNLHPNE